jgi:hypothetical protein
MKWVVLQWPTKRLVCRSRCWHLKSVWHFVWIYLRARIYWGCPCGIIFAARSLTTSYYSWRESWTLPFFGTCRTSTSISPWSSCHLLETSPILGGGSMWESLLQRSFKLPGASCNTSWNTTWYDMIIRPFSRAELHRYLFIVNRHWYHWRHWYNWYHCDWAIYNDVPWYHHGFTVDNHRCTMIYHDLFSTSISRINRLWFQAFKLSKACCLASWGSHRAWGRHRWGLCLTGVLNILKLFCRSKNDE